MLGENKTVGNSGSNAKPGRVENAERKNKYLLRYGGLIATALFVLVGTACSFQGFGSGSQIARKLMNRAPKQMDVYMECGEKKHKVKLSASDLPEIGEKLSEGEEEVDSTGFYYDLLTADDRCEAKHKYLEVLVTTKKESEEIPKDVECSIVLDKISYKGPKNEQGYTYFKNKLSRCKTYETDPQLTALSLLIGHENMDRLIAGGFLEKYSTEDVSHCLSDDNVVKIIRDVSSNPKMKGRYMEYINARNNGFFALNSRVEGGLEELEGMANFKAVVGNVKGQHNCEFVGNVLSFIY